jgi:hypothetical protein
MTSDSTLELWTCNGGANQKWTRQSNGSLVNPASGTCLDAYGGSSADGTRLIIYTCTGGANQQWTAPQ